MTTLKLICSLFLLLNFSAFLGATETSSFFDLDEVYSISENGTVHLDSEDAEVQITASERSDVRVQVRYSQKKGGLWSSKGSTLEEFEITERNGDLYLNDIFNNRNNFVFFGWTNTDYVIEIEIPKSVNIELRGEDDDYELKGITGDIELDAVDGDVVIRDCTSKIDLEMVDGDVSIKRCSGKAKIELVDGELQISRGQFEDLKVETVDGDMDIETSLKSDGNYRIATTDGDVSLEITKGGAEIRIDRGDGDVNVCREFKERRSRSADLAYQLEDGGAEIYMLTVDGDIDLKAD